MLTAATLREKGFVVRQSQHYLDSDTEKSRESDVVCSIGDTLGLAHLCLVVERKAGSKPWVVFSSSRTLADYKRLLALGVLSKSVRKALAQDVRRAAKQVRWFKKDRRVGYGVAQAFANRDDLPFGRVTPRE